MDFLNREIQTNNDITGNYNVQPPQRKTNAMKCGFLNESFHRQNLLQKFQVATEFSSEFHQSSTGQSSSQAVVRPKDLNN